MRLSLTKNNGIALLAVVLSDLQSHSSETHDFGDMQVTSLLTEGKKPAGYRLAMRNCLEAYKFPHIAFMIGNRHPNQASELEAVLVTQHVRVLHHDGNYVVILRPTKQDTLKDVDHEF